MYVVSAWVYVSMFVLSERRGGPAYHISCYSIVPIHCSLSTLELLDCNQKPLPVCPACRLATPGPGTCCLYMEITPTLPLPQPPPTASQAWVWCSARQGGCAAAHGFTTVFSFIDSVGYVLGEGAQLGMWEGSVPTMPEALPDLQEAGWS